MDLKIKDVAELLQVSEATIQRWLKDGEIPFYRIHGDYCFNRTEIEDWVLKQNVAKKGDSISFSPFHNEEDPANKSGSKQFGLYRALHKGQVLLNVPGNTKEEVIRNTMKSLEKDLNLDADVLTDLLLERENLMPTALNQGIGVPHTRDFLLSAHYDVVTVVFPKKPIEYGALDGLPVHTLFFLFACEDKRHLHLLAKIAHLSSQNESLALLQKKPSKDKLLDYVKEWESGLTRHYEEEENLESLSDQSR